MLGRSGLSPLRLSWTACLRLHWELFRQVPQPSEMRWREEEEGRGGWVQRCRQIWAGIKMYAAALLFPPKNGMYTSIIVSSSLRVMFPDLEDKACLAQLGSPGSRENNAKSNTLGDLTQTFVQLIQSAADQRIEIDEASRRLNIQKRRIYDITNVLEGIGYIEKIGKNQMKWVGGERGNQLLHEASRLELEHEQVDQETRDIEREIDRLKSDLLVLSKDHRDFNYLQGKDLETIMKALRVTQILLYSGSIGDQLQNDSNPEKKTSQCIIESTTADAKIFYCQYTDGCDDTQEQPSTYEAVQAIVQVRSPEPQGLRVRVGERCSGDIFQESEVSEGVVTPRPFFQHDFGLNLPLYDLSPEKKAEEEFFQSDSNE